MIKCITVAGFDPSAGAGILADIKTFERFEVYGFAACTAVTVQNEYTFSDPGWLEDVQIIDQLECLFEEHRFDTAKIGLVKDVDSLLKIIRSLVTYNPGIRIIWDPILKSSTGFSFHDSLEKEILSEILSMIYLVTPNLPEAEMLGIKDGSLCNVLLKGGHSDLSICEDLLFQSNGSALSFTTDRINGNGKHGSGCVLSAAIAANLALGNSLPESCQAGKDYVTDFIQSNSSLLGVHKGFFQHA